MQRTVVAAGVRCGRGVEITRVKRDGLWVVAIDSVARREVRGSADRRLDLSSGTLDRPVEQLARRPRRRCWSSCGACVTELCRR